MASSTSGSASHRPSRRSSSRYSTVVRPVVADSSSRCMRYSRNVSSSVLVPGKVDEFDKHGHRIDNKPRMENTYRLTPEPTEMFRSYIVTAIMDTILKDKLEGEQYNGESCRNLCIHLANTIKERVQCCRFSKRYKYVCQVSIWQNKSQGVELSSRCLWDCATDNSASSVYAHGDVVAVALLHALYLE